MEKPLESFAWDHRLECPPTIYNDSVKKKLRIGLIGIMWDDITNATFSAKEVELIRKNILLYRLKHDIPNTVIQCARHMSSLKSTRNELNSQISKLEEEYEQQDFVLRRKVNHMRSISAMRLKANLRRDLLKMKHSQTTTQLQDCVDMRLVCQHLMPGTCKDLDPQKMRAMLDAVTALCSGANKRQVRDTISNTLGSIEIPTLWLHLYQNLTDDVERLVKFETVKTLDSMTSKENIDIQIAKGCGQHISVISRRLLHDARANKHQEAVLELIEQIEAASTNPVDISEWLALVLELRKWEIEQTNLQVEIAKIQESLHENNAITTDLVQLRSDIQYIDAEMEEYVSDIQQSLILLQSAPKLIMIIKEKICLELQKIIAMRIDGYDSTWLKDDLNTELDVFHNTLDLSALRKIMLKGDVGIYRHTKRCFDEGSISVTSSQGSNVKSYFPTIQIPIYSLIECYKILTATVVYKKLESLKMDENLDVPSMPTLPYKKDHCNTVEILNRTKVICDKTEVEINQFNDILNAWTHQTVQKAMNVVNKTVDDISLPEWSERYNLLLYMIQNST